MRKRNVLYLFAIVWLSVFSHIPEASDLKRKIALFDLTVRNGEPSQSNLFSTSHALKVAGCPFITTDNLQEAVEYFLIVFSSKLQDASFTDTERSTLANYVTGGGILVSTRVYDPGLYNVFGISGYEKNKNRHLMNWNMASEDSSLHWFDEPEEQTISLGKSTYTEVIETAGYQTGNATALAYFEDRSAAVTVNRYGSGYAYAIGFSFKDIILRNQIDMDFDAQRYYSNGFEPTSDTVMLFLRGICEKHLPSAVYKNTAPGTAGSVFIITHDTCSRTANEMMNDFADLERAKALTATYMIHTYYLDIPEYLGAPYYKEHIPDLISLKSKGMKFGSHSVGHFPDFDKFEEGLQGNTMESYTPYYDGTQTTEGTVYGELEVSKNLVETDVGASVPIFRSGHLWWNEKQINVMDALGYRYDTSRSGGNVLTNFPYQCLYDTSYQGDVSNIYEIPLTISDVIDGFSEETVQEAVDMWLGVTRKNSNNGASTVILIHPNRTYKLDAEDILIDSLPQYTRVMDMESFGDFWRNRDAFTFRSEIEGNTLTVVVPDGMQRSFQSLMVTDSQNISSVNVRNESGQNVEFSQRVRDDLTILYNIGITIGDIDINGTVDISDVILCLRMSVGLTAPDCDIADMNTDGSVDISDVILSLRKAIGLDD